MSRLVIDVAGRVKAKQDESLFAAPDPERIVLPEDRHLLPWVSMAQALGWGMTARPTHTITGGGTGGGGGVEVFASNDTRAIIERERSEGRWALRNGNQPRAAVRPASAPAPTMHFGHNRNEVTWVCRTENFAGPKIDGKPVKYERPLGDPAPTVGSRADLWEVGHPTHQARNSGPGAAREPRPLDAPSYTIRSAGSGTAPAGVEWVTERPATTVNGDPRTSEPGHHDSDVSGSQQANAVRVTLEEAAILQSFAPDYPWQGTKTKRFEQVGNAVPPLMAKAILSAIPGVAVEAERSAA